MNTADFLYLAQDPFCNHGRNAPVVISGVLKIHMQFLRSEHADGDADESVFQHPIFLKAFGNKVPLLVRRCGSEIFIVPQGIICEKREV